MARNHLNLSTATAILLALGGSCTRRTISCQTFPDLEPVACELTKDAGVIVSGQSLANLAFGPEGLGSILVGNRDPYGLYFVNRQGKTAPALMFDNGADYVVEGLARTVKGGKVGFVNTRLDEVV